MADASLGKTAPISAAVRAADHPTENSARAHAGRERKQQATARADVPGIATDSVSERSPALGPFNPVNLIRLLMSTAAAHLASDDLHAIVDGGASFVDQSARHAAEVAEGLGCLVADDDAAGVGSFQSGQDVAGLLFHMAEHLQALAGISAAVGLAASELVDRSRK